VIKWSEQAQRDIKDWPATDGLGLTSTARSQLEQLVSRLDKIVAD